MIPLQEIFQDLATGEFAELHISQNGITSQAWPGLVSLVNFGVLDLHTRLILRKRRVTVTPEANRTLYPIRSPHVGSFLSAPETPDDALDVSPIIRLLHVMDDTGRDWVLDQPVEENEPYLLRTEYDTFQVPVIKGPLPAHWIVTYQSTPKAITVEEGFDPQTVTVKLPPILKGALLNFMASRQHAAKVSMLSEGQPDPSQTYWTRYMTEVARLIQHPVLFAGWDATYHRFERNGWT